MTEDEVETAGGGQGGEARRGRRRHSYFKEVAQDSH